MNSILFNLFLMVGPLKRKNHQKLMKSRVLNDSTKILKLKKKIKN